MKDYSERIRNAVSNYVSGSVSLDEFEEWFSDVLASPEPVEPSSEDHAYEIEFLLAESSRGGWSENDLKEQMEPFGVPHVEPESGKAEARELPIPTESHPFVTFSSSSSDQKFYVQRLAESG